MMGLLHAEIDTLTVYMILEYRVHPLAYMDSTQTYELSDNIIYCILKHKSHVKYRTITESSNISNGHEITFTV